MLLEEEIAADLAKITEAEIARVSGNLDEVAEGETVLLESAPPRLCALWALGVEYKRKAMLAEHAYLFDATKEQKAPLRAKISRLYSLASLLERFGWIEMRDWAGDAAWVSSVGIRKNFCLVATKGTEEEQQEAEVRAAAVPLELMRSLFKAISDHAAPDDDEAPPKPKKKAN